MPVAVQQRLLARVRDQDESLGILIGVFAINPVLQRSCPLFGIVVARFSAFRQFLVLKRHIGQAVSWASLLPAPVGARKQLAGGNTRKTSAEI